MRGHKLTRRVVLGLMVSLVAVGGVGGAPSVSADQKRPDWPSGDQFELDCKLMGGVFIRDRYGDTFCFLPDGDYINCDSNGKDCWYIPPPKEQPPTFPQDPYVLPGDGATANPDSAHFVLPHVVQDDLVLAKGQPTAQDDDQAPSKGKKKIKGNKKRSNGGKKARK